MEKNTKNFMDGDFLLTNGVGKRLYAFAAGLPIYDYHCHLSPKEICQNRRFYNLAELWLECDHYKWRLMRACGVAESLITGNAEPYEKFAAFCSVLPDCIGNPVYHWAHMELKKYFAIELPICQKNAREIWDVSAQYMTRHELTAQKLLEQSAVECLITTDDPIDSLQYHKQIAAAGLPFKVLPCFRPDKAVNIEKAEFNSYIKTLSEAAEIKIDSFGALTDALEKRLDYFSELGCVSADCSFSDFPKGKGDFAAADKILKRKLSGSVLSAEEEAEYKFCALLALLKLLARKDKVSLIHTGVMRNCSSRLYQAVGADAGADSVGKEADIEAARELLDKASSSEFGLPKTMIYTLNPASYYPLATLLGDFSGMSRGRLQLGAAWWFCDHKSGIEEQMRVFSQVSAFGCFNGMLTDSRSFLSYARHDYFRRILCSAIGERVENGEYPDDEQALERLTGNICYFNAANYFGGKA
jgi:glucuronate isomerase